MYMLLDDYLRLHPNERQNEQLQVTERSHPLEITGKARGQDKSEYIVCKISGLAKHNLCACGLVQQSSHEAPFKIDWDTKIYWEKIPAGVIRINRYTLFDYMNERDSYYLAVPVLKGVQSLNCAAIFVTPYHQVEFQ